jgi:hypothetical protein
MRYVLTTAVLLVALKKRGRFGSFVRIESH